MSGRVVRSAPQDAADYPPALSPAPDGRASPRYGRKRAAIRIPTTGCSPLGFYQTCVSIQVRAALLPTKPPIPASARRRKRRASDSLSDAASRNDLPSIGSDSESLARRFRRRALAGIGGFVGS